MGLMTLGAVLVLGDRLTAPATAQVGSDAVALAKDLHRSRRGADFHDLLHQSVRHTVKVPIEVFKLPIVGDMAEKQAGL